VYLPPCAPQAASCQEPMTESTTNIYDSLQGHTSTEHVPFEVAVDGKLRGKFFVEVGTPDAQVQAALQPILGTKVCRACHTRAKDALQMHGASGWLAETVFPVSMLHSAHFAGALQHQCKQQEELNVRFVTHMDALGTLQQGKAADGTPWTHLYMGVGGEWDGVTKLLPNDCMQPTLRHYKGMLHSMLNAHAAPGIQASLQVLEQSLGTVTYGHKLLHSVQWLKKVCVEEWPHMNAVQRAAHVATAVVLALGMNTPRVDQVLQLPVYHQSKNTVLDALGSAASLEALEALLTARLDPHTYQQRTVAPTQTSLDIARKTLGDIDVQYMRLDDIQGWGAFVPKGRQGTVASTATASEAAAAAESTPASASAWDAVQTKPKRRAKPPRASKAAQRAAAAVQFGATLPLKLTTLEGVVRALQDGTEVQVLANGSKSSVLAFTTTFGDSVQYPFLWSFKNQPPGGRLRTLGSTQPVQWVSLAGVLPLDTRHNSQSYMLVGKDLTVRDADQKCFIPEFLSASLKRTCGAAFAALKKTWTMRVPEGAMAAGVGATAKSDAGELTCHVAVRTRVHPKAPWTQHTISNTGSMPERPAISRSGI